MSSRGSRPSRTLLVVGTRPEAIKMAPLIRECAKRPGEIETIVCFTGQHREMLAQVADYFQISPDFDLQVMRPGQTLTELTCRCLEGLDTAVRRYAPECIVAQGDTTTVFASATTAVYHRLPFLHVEAGLRTGDLWSPWPEEYNRRVASIGAALHFAPTPSAADNLLAEGVSRDAIEITGNTVIDALLWTVSNERSGGDVWKEKHASWLGNRMVLITGHRRESFGGPFESICTAIATLADRYGDTHFVYPVHLNPNVREPVERLLSKRPNIHLLEPASYPEFVWLMDQSTLVLTDSGGVQEEAPSLRKPVLVMREKTERPEGVDAGAVKLVGAGSDRIVAETARLLEDEAAYRSLQVDENPYGDGRASERIAELIARRAWSHG